jgi:hypothetical protein
MGRNMTTLSFERKSSILGIRFLLSILSGVKRLPLK